MIFVIVQVRKTDLHYYKRCTSLSTALPVILGFSSLVFRNRDPFLLIHAKEDLLKDEEHSLGKLRVGSEV